MLISRDIAERSTDLVSRCGLDTLSIFFRNRSTCDIAGLTYLFHHGVSDEAKHAYHHGRVFQDDPFTRDFEANDRMGRLVHWGEQRLARHADTAPSYRSFINCHGVDVVGAWVQQVLPDFFLVIGAHCRPGGHRRTNVSMPLLEREASGISQMVMGELLGSVVECAGTQALNRALGQEQSSAKDLMDSLSPREQEIARLVGEGKQNKQIAYLVGISEFTVENHLRRIYRKLEVHNRTAMTALLLQPTFQ